MRKKAAKPETPCYIRAYSHSLAGVNTSKVKQVLGIFEAYTELAVDVREAQLRLWFTTGKLNKNEPIQSDTALSARYQQTCQYQVVGMLKSWMALRQDDFRQLVLRSSLEGDFQHELLSLNFRKAWYRKDLIGQCYTKKGEPVLCYTAEGLRFAANLMRRLRSLHRFPSMRNINLALDEKVAQIELASRAFPLLVAGGLRRRVSGA